MGKRIPKNPASRNGNNFKIFLPIAKKYVIITVCTCGEIGIHATLRWQCLRVCQFESSQVHQKITPYGVLFCCTRCVPRGKQVHQLKKSTLVDFFSWYLDQTRTQFDWTTKRVKEKSQLFYFRARRNRYFSLREKYRLVRSLK